MSYVRRLYEAHGSGWEGIEESQSYLDRKLITANGRKHGSTLRRPIDDWNALEKPALRALPALANEREEFHEGTVRSDGHVRFRGKYYSVSEKYIREKVIVLGSSKQVSIYHQGELIEVHERLTDPYSCKSTKQHHLKPWEQAMREESAYLLRAKAMGASVEKLIPLLLSQGGGFIDTRKIWGILSLDKTSSPAQNNFACQEALELQSISYHTVKNLLKLGVTHTRRPLEFEGQSDENKSWALKTAEGGKKPHPFIRTLSEYKNQFPRF